MKRLNGRLRLPSPAITIAVIALVVALTGTAVAAKKLGLGALSNGAKNKTVGVGKLTYVTNTVTLTQASDNDLTATCPSGLRVVGGGIKVNDTALDFVDDSYPTTSGWAATVDAAVGSGRTAVITAICATSRVVFGSPPGS
jgi:hypothetical protein